MQKTKIQDTSNVSRQERQSHKLISCFEQLWRDDAPNEGIEYRTENFNLKTLIKICKLLDVTLAEFFEDVEVPKGGKKKKK